MTTPTTATPLSPNVAQVPLALAHRHQQRSSTAPFRVYSSFNSQSSGNSRTTHSDSSSFRSVFLQRSPSSFRHPSDRSCPIEDRNHRDIATRVNDDYGTATDAGNPDGFDAFATLMTVRRQQSQSTLSTYSTLSSYQTKRPSLQRTVAIPHPQPPRKLQDLIALDRLLSSRQRVVLETLLDLASHCRGDGKTDPNHARDNCNAIYQAGGHDCIVLAMVQNGSNLHIQCTGFGLLQNVAFFLAPDCRPVVGLDGGMDYIVMVLEMHCRSSMPPSTNRSHAATHAVVAEKIVRRACGALAALTTDCIDNVVSLVEDLNGLPVLVSVLQKYATSSTVQQRVIHILHNICKSSWEYRHCLVFLWSYVRSAASPGGGSHNNDLASTAYLEHFHALDVLHDRVSRFPSNAILQRKAWAMKKYLEEYIVAWIDDALKTDLQVPLKRAENDMDNAAAPIDDDDNGDGGQARPVGQSPSPSHVANVIQQIGMLCRSFRASELFYSRDGISKVLQVMDHFLLSRRPSFTRAVSSVSNIYTIVAASAQMTAAPISSTDQGSLKVVSTGTSMLYQLSSHDQLHGRQRSIKKHVGPPVIATLVSVLRRFPDQYEVHVNAWFTIANLICRCKHNAGILVRRKDGIALLMKGMFKFTSMATKSQAKETSERAGHRNHASNTEAVTGKLSSSTLSSAKNDNAVASGGDRFRRIQYKKQISMVTFDLDGDGDGMGLASRNVQTPFVQGGHCKNGLGNGNRRVATEEKKEEITAPTIVDGTREHRDRIDDGSRDRAFDDSSSLTPFFCSTPLQIQLIGFWILQHVCRWKEFRGRVKRTEGVSTALSAFLKVETRATRCRRRQEGGSAMGEEQPVPFEGCRKLMQGLGYMVLSE